MIRLHSTGLGRKYAPDDRDKVIWQTPLRIDPATVTNTYRYWNMGGTVQRLDQGNTGHCVGFGSTSYLFTGPVTHPSVAFTNDYAHRLYYDCKVIDGEPGAEDGTYVRSGMKVLRNRGLVDAYYFAWDIDSVTLRVRADRSQGGGPVTVGVSWYNSMYDVDNTYLIPVRPTSGLAGGHCLTITGINMTTGRVRLLNSWGTGWGLNGYAFMRIDDLAALLDDYGEMALATELTIAGTDRKE